MKARRLAAGATATFGYSGSLSMGISLSDKLSASQYSLTGENTVQLQCTVVCTRLGGLHACTGVPISSSSMVFLWCRWRACW